MDQYEQLLESIKPRDQASNQASDQPSDNYEDLLASIKPQGNPEPAPTDNYEELLKQIKPESAPNPNPDQQVAADRARQAALPAGNVQQTAKNSNYVVNQIPVSEPIDNTPLFPGQNRKPEPTTPQNEELKRLGIIPGNFEGTAPNDIQAQQEQAKQDKAFLGLYNPPTPDQADKIPKPITVLNALDAGAISPDAAKFALEQHDGVKFPEDFGNPDNGGLTKQDIIKFTTGRDQLYPEQRPKNIATDFLDSLKKAADRGLPNPTNIPSETFLGILGDIFQENTNNSNAKTQADALNQIKQFLPGGTLSADDILSGYEFGQKILGENVAGETLGKAFNFAQMLFHGFDSVIYGNKKSAQFSEAIPRALNGDLDSASKVLQGKIDVMPQLQPLVSASTRDNLKSDAMVEVRKDPANVLMVVDAIASLGTKLAMFQLGRRGKPMPEWVLKSFGEDAKTGERTPVYEDLKNAYKDGRDGKGINLTEIPTRIPIVGQIFRKNISENFTQNDIFSLLQKERAGTTTPAENDFLKLVKDNVSSYEKENQTPEGETRDIAKIQLTRPQIRDWYQNLNKFFGNKVREPGTTVKLIPEEVSAKAEDAVNEVDRATQANDPNNVQPAGGAVQPQEMVNPADVGQPAAPPVTSQFDTGQMGRPPETMTAPEAPPPEPTEVSKAKIDIETIPAKIEALQPRKTPNQAFPEDRSKDFILEPDPTGKDTKKLQSDLENAQKIVADHLTSQHKPEAVTAPEPPTIKDIESNAKDQNDLIDLKHILNKEVPSDGAIERLRKRQLITTVDGNPVITNYGEQILRHDMARTGEQFPNESFIPQEQYQKQLGQQAQQARAPEVIEPSETGQPAAPSEVPKEAALKEPVSPSETNQSQETTFAKELKRVNEERQKKGIAISPEEQKAQEYALTHQDELRARYEQLILDEFGSNRVVSADAGKYAVPGFTDEMSAHFHEIGSALAKEKYEKLLADPATKDLPVAFTSGGSGSGKTASLKISGNLDRFAAIYDTNLNNLKSGTQKINQALDSGRHVIVNYVHRDPVVSWLKGVIPRIKTQRRIVPISAHLDTHLNALPVFKQLKKDFQGKPVKFDAYDNTGGKGEMKLVPIDSLKRFDYTLSGLKKAITDETQKALERGDINERQYQTILGENRPGTLEENSGNSEGSRPVGGSELPQVEGLHLGRDSGIPEESRRKVQEEVVEPPQPPVKPPSEPSVPSSESPKSPTSIQNAVVDQERQARGLPPLMKEAQRDFGTVWNDALAKIDASRSIGKDAADDLIKDIQKKPRATTDEENAILLHKKIEVSNALDKVNQKILDAHESGDQSALVEGRFERARLEDSLVDIDEVSRTSGTELGRGLNARKMMANEDFSLAKMVVDKRAANDGRPLTDAEHTHIADLHKKIGELESTFEKYKAASEDKIAKLRVDEAIAKTKKTVAPAKPKTATILKFIDNQADAALQRIRARRGRAMAGLDPAEIADHVIVGASFIAKGAIKFGEWSARMVKEFGDYVKPHLQEIFDKATEEAKTMLKNAGDELAQQRDQILGGIKSAFSEGVPVSDLGRYVQKLAENFVGSGIVDREALIDSVHAELKKVIPDVTRREAMDAISGYGKFKPLSSDEISVQLRDLKGQMQQLGKLEDMQKGQPPAKTGMERRPVSDAERRLIQQVNEAKRKGGFNVTDPAKQLKTSLDAVKTNLKNQIKDLEFQIATGKKIVKEKTSVALDTEAESLKKQRDVLKQRFTEIFGKPELTDEQRIKIATGAVEKSIADLETRIKNNDLGPRTRESKTPNTPELEAARAKRDALKDQLQELRDFANPKKTPDEIANSAFKARTSNRIAELREKIANKDFSTKPHNQVNLDSEAMRLKADVERVKQQYNQELTKDKMKNRTGFEKTMDAVVKWRRASLLSGFKVLGKLTSAAVARIVITPAEEAIGEVLHRAFPKLSELAPRQGGGLNLRAEVKALTEGLTSGMRDAWQILRTGHSELDLLYGKKMDLPQDFLDVFGNIHGALKAAVKRAEFARSFEKRALSYAKQGVDVTDEFVQTKIAIEAYEDASRSIFMQKNIVANAIDRGLQSLEEVNKTTGKVPVGKKALSTLVRVALPIKRVPTNIVAETMEYAMGTLTGSAKLAKAYREGISKLSPEEAELIMRHLKKGNLGAAVLLTGFLVPTMFGGFYQPGEKRKKGEIKADEARIGGVDIPSQALHFPLAVDAQLGSTIARVADSKLRKKDKDTQGLTGGAIAGALGLADSTPFIREMTEIEKLRNPQQRGKAGSAFLASLIIPQGIKEIAQFMDKDAEGNPIQREPTTTTEAIEAAVPGLRQNVPVKKPSR